MKDIKFYSFDKYCFVNNVLYILRNTTIGFQILFSIGRTTFIFSYIISSFYVSIEEKLKHR